MKVLLADDDSDQLAVRSMLLAKNGIETLEARDAPTALKLAQSGKPDCAVVDLRLPSVQAGLGLIRDLKQLHWGLHVFVLTGAPGRFAETPERALVDEVLVKGGSASELVRKLKSACATIADLSLSGIADALRSSGTVTFTVKVIPRSSRTEIAGIDGSTLKVRVAAVPEKGKANEELREALAEQFHVPKTGVEILTGETSQQKRIRLTARRSAGDCGS